MHFATAAELTQPSRRAFLRDVAGLLASGSIAACNQPQPIAVPARTSALGEIIGAGQFAENGHRRFVLSLLNLDSNRSPRLIGLEFFGHGVAIDPTAPQRAFVFEKTGKGACEVDLRAGRLIRPLATTESRQFYGHGSFSNDGSLLYATETDVTAGNAGAIIVRDAVTLAEREAFPTYGLKPHDCTLIDGGKTLVVTNGGGPRGGDKPCVCYVDIGSRKLLERLDVPRDEFNAGHLALHNGALAVTSAPREGTPDPMTRPGALSLRRPGQPLRTMADPADVTTAMLGETLSLAIHAPSRTLAATNPAGDLVTFWHLDECRLLSALRIAKPRGVALALDGRSFVLTYSPEARVCLIDAVTREPIPDRDWTGSLITGSHIVSHQPLL